MDEREVVCVCGTRTQEAWTGQGWHMRPHDNSEGVWCELNVPASEKTEADNTNLRPGGSKTQRGDELRDLLNKHNAENESNTPDSILALFLETCLAAFNVAVQQRETCYGRDASPSLPGTPVPPSTAAGRALATESGHNAQLDAWIAGTVAGFAAPSEQTGETPERRRE